MRVTPRKSQRDGGASKQALRRMAYQVNQPGVRSVLHDALLETFPEYGRLIDFAERVSREDGLPHIILFNPRALKKGLDRHRIPYATQRFALFSGASPYKFTPWAPAFLGRLRSRPEYKDHVLVYIAGLPRDYPSHLRRGGMPYSVRGAT